MWSMLLTWRFLKVFVITIYSSGRLCVEMERAITWNTMGTLKQDVIIRPWLYIIEALMHLFFYLLLFDLHTDIVSLTCWMDIIWLTTWRQTQGCVCILFQCKLCFEFIFVLWIHNCVDSQIITVSAGQPWGCGSEDPDAGLLMMTSAFIYSDVNSSLALVPRLLPNCLVLSAPVSLHTF